MGNTFLHCSVTIHAPLEKVWEYFTTPEHITKWNFAIDTWCCPAAVNDLKVGGRFNYRMEARDGSFGFDFWGDYTEIALYDTIAYKLGDDRLCTLKFISHHGQTFVTEDFEPEATNPHEMQQGGWQSILNQFKSYVESH